MTTNYFTVVLKGLFSISDFFAPREFCPLVLVKSMPAKASYIGRMLLITLEYQQIFIQDVFNSSITVMFNSFQGTDDKSSVYIDTHNNFAPIKASKGVEICKRNSVILSHFIHRTKLTCLAQTLIYACYETTRMQLSNKSSNFRQEMSYKAKEQSENSDIFPTSPSSDKSSSSLSPTSTLTRGKRKHRKASDKGYGSTNSSLSESGRPLKYVYSVFISMCSLQRQNQEGISCCILTRIGP